MPEYLTPGVYMEEFEIGARPIEGVSTSTAGFLGMTERGPTDTVKLVTSMDQYMRIYGGYIKDSYLTYALQGFFGNGGQRCFIGRIVREKAAKAGKKINDVTFKAVGEGAWGNRVALRIDNASNDPENEKENGKKIFKLTIAYWNESGFPKDFKKNDKTLDKALNELLEAASTVEIFDNLSEDPGDSEYFMKKLGENNLSFLLYIEKKSSGRPDNTTDDTTLFVRLEDGLDAEGVPPGELSEPVRDDFLGDPKALPGTKRGLTAFNDIDEISIVYVPDLYKIQENGIDTLIDDILSHCESLKDRFAILDIPENQNDLNSIMIKRSSKYGALYYPWIRVYDPLTKQQKQIPPGGHVAGIYARSDTERGVHKAPANETVRGAVGLEFAITKREQGLLNPRGINVIRSFNGRGIMVWGARTCIIDALWKYINVRRLFIYVEESIEKGTQWVVFEPNNEKLWARVKATITQFLTGVWRDGALMGLKADEAFFVKCDRTTMTQDDIDNGRLICVIGIAPVKPAEFVIFRIAQWAGGSAATE